MAARKANRTYRATSRSKENNKQSFNWLNLFRFGESYSSLLLGIVVVIITTILLVFLVKDRNTTQITMKRGVSSTNTERNNGNNIAKIDLTPTVTVGPNVTDTPLPTKTPTITPAKKPTSAVQPTKIIPTAVPTKIIAKVTTFESKSRNLKIHTVTNGENLWSIAEKYYKSGFNWVDISNVNKLSNPGLITLGMKLTIPDVAPKTATVITIPSDMTVYGPKITASTYTVKKSDHLWGVAVRAYNDGYKWVEIARVNNLNTPDVIHPGLVLKLPKTAPPSQK